MGAVLTENKIMTNLIEIKKEVTKQLADKESVTALVSTVFKGFPEPLMRRAITEGMMRGFNFQDFLEKNIYAIKYGDAYSLVTSIDHARKVGMRSGIVGKSAPLYVEEQAGGVTKIISCTVTVKRKVNEHIGDYSATVFFSEYSTNKNLWVSKPRTMIAKVAEMHALRMACPEELSQAYVEEEREREVIEVKNEANYDEYRKKIESAKTLDELKSVWSALPVEAKTEFETLKNETKAKLTTPINENPKV